MKISVGPDVVVFNPADRTVRGEGASLLIRENEILRLGMEPVQLGVGDLLLLHGKGLTAARNVIEDTYGLTRLREQAAGLAGLDPGSLLAAVFEDLYVFTGGRLQEIDLILVAMRVDAV